MIQSHFITFLSINWLVPEVSALLRWPSNVCDVGYLGKI